MELRARRFGVWMSSTVSPSTVLPGLGHTMGEALLCSSKEPSRDHQVALGAVCLSIVSQFEQLIRLAHCFGSVWGYWLCDRIRTSRRTLGTPGRYTEGHCQFGESPGSHAVIKKAFLAAIIACEVVQVSLTTSGYREKYSPPAGGSSLLIVGRDLSQKLAMGSLGGELASKACWLWLLLCDRLNNAAPVGSTGSKCLATRQRISPASDTVESLGGPHESCLESLSVGQGEQQCVD